MTIRKFFALLALGGLFLTARPAAAQRTGINLTIGDVTIIGNDRARIFISAGSVTGSANPNCPSNPNHFAIDISTNKGKALLSLATSAMIAGRLVYVTGSANNCTMVDTLNIQMLDQLTMI